MTKLICNWFWRIWFTDAPRVTMSQTLTELKFRVKTFWFDCDVFIFWTWCIPSLDLYRNLQWKLSIADTIGAKNRWLSYTRCFFYKNTLHKNNQDRIYQKVRNVLRIRSSYIFAKKVIFFQKKYNIILVGLLYSIIFIPFLFAFSFPVLLFS